MQKITEGVFFQTASYLTEPVTRMHESFCRYQILNKEYPNEGFFSFKKVSLLFTSCSYFFLSLFTTVVGGSFRFIAVRLQREGFSYAEEKAEEKKEGTLAPIGSQKTSLIKGQLQNICAMPGGYAILTGNVLPWPDRREQVVADLL